MCSGVLRSAGSSGSTSAFISSSLCTTLAAAFPGRACRCSEVCPVASRAPGLAFPSSSSRTASSGARASSAAAATVCPRAFSQLQSALASTSAATAATGSPRRARSAPNKGVLPVPTAWSTSASLRIKSWTILGWPRAAAAYRAVIPLSGVWLGRALPSRSKRIVSVRPWTTATTRGVAPLLGWPLLGSTPWLRASLTLSASPFRTAECKSSARRNPAVSSRPCATAASSAAICAKFVAATSAPSATSTRTRSVAPSPAAKISGVAPSSGARAFTSARASTAAFATSSSPVRHAARKRVSPGAS
mmetsp:Transcript_102101/g.233898  ORF Transcript_102101/g.233898 Transcript_102101/m.233898 type:complete len:304 (-) Transcript_102101:173-1084(-)